MNKYHRIAAALLLQGRALAARAYSWLEDQKEGVETVATVIHALTSIVRLVLAFR